MDWLGTRQHMNNCKTKQCLARGPGRTFELVPLEADRSHLWPRQTRDEELPELLLGLCCRDAELRDVESLKMAADARQAFTGVRNSSERCRNNPATFMGRPHPSGSLASSSEPSSFPRPASPAWPGGRRPLCPPLSTAAPGWRRRLSR